MADERLKFEVQGAGEIHVSPNANGWCGSAVGFNIGVTWGRHGLAGGVMDRTEAKRLADHIYAALAAPGLKTMEQLERELYQKISA